MSNPYFQFKQFTVRHDKCAMKVGTDGVLLGAWAPVQNAKYILDVGAGSGLISLQLAQRNPWACPRRSSFRTISRLHLRRERIWRLWEMSQLIC